MALELQAPIYLELLFISHFISLLILNQFSHRRVSRFSGFICCGSERAILVKLP